MKKFHTGEIGGKQSAFGYLSENLKSQDYFSEKEQTKGYYMGELAKVFELNGKEVGKELELLEQGINPVTGQRNLNERYSDKRITGYDYQCSCDKSISIMVTVGEDKRLIDAHDEAIKEAVAELEKYIGVRDRTGDKANSRESYLTGNMIASVFTHKSSRDLDPQLHSHVYIPNFTYDAKIGKFKAIEGEAIQKNIGYLGRIYQNALHRKVKNLGYETCLEYNKKGEIKGFQIKSIPKEIIKLYSKRSTAITIEADKFEKQNGRLPTKAERDIITRETRKDKLYNISDKEILTRQKSQLTNRELKNIELAKSKALKTQKIRQAIRFNKEEIDRKFSNHGKIVTEQIRHLSERKSTFTIEDLKKECLRVGSGNIELPILDGVIKRHKDLISLDEGTLISTEIVKEESVIVECVNNGVGKENELNGDYRAFNDKESLKLEKEGFEYKEQRLAVHKILQSKDKYIVFRGVAGAGKSTTLKQVKKGLEEAGKKSLFYTPSSSATENLINDGFHEAKNLARLITQYKKGQLDKLQNSIKGSVIIVDEAGQISTKDGKIIIEIAEKYNCKVIFTGDSKQHGSVVRGDNLRLIEQNTKTTKVEVTKIFRQNDPELLKVAEKLSKGMAKEAMQDLRGLGHVEEGGNYLKKTAEAYVKDIKGGKELDKARASAPTRAEVARFASYIRTELKKSGFLEGKDTEFKTFQSFDYTEVQKQNINSYRVGCLITFNQLSGSRHKQNETYKIIGREKSYCILSDGSKFFPEKSGRKVDIGTEVNINLTKNDVIRISSNDKKLGVKNGYYFKIDTIENGEITAKKLDKDFKEISQEIKFNAEQFKRYQQGYVGTSWKRQGGTYNNHFVAGKSMDSKTAYVLGTRGKEHYKVFTPNTEKLEKSTNNTGDRLLATDKVKEVLTDKITVDILKHKEHDNMHSSLLKFSNDIKKILI